MRFANGSRYLPDRSAGTEFPLWRLQGKLLTPLREFERGEVSVQIQRILSVLGEPVMIANIGGVQCHWRIEGEGIVSLADEFGPVPFTEDPPWLPRSDGTIIPGVDDLHGRELWLVNENGYRLIKDVNPGPASATPTWIPSALFQGGNATHYLFSLENGELGFEPWVYANGELTLLGDSVPGSESADPRRIGRRGETLYFGTSYNRIYKLDGSELSLIVENSREYSHVGQSADYFELGNDLYAWFWPSSFDVGYILRISADESVESFWPTTRVPEGAVALSLRSVAPFNGAI